MFCAIATTIERCKTEGVVDVFQVVKAMRNQKPGAVRTVVSPFKTQYINTAFINCLFVCLLVILHIYLYYDPGIVSL